MTSHTGRSTSVQARARAWLPWLLAVLAMLVTLPALVLYNAGLAVFAVVLAGLRLVRAPGAES